MGRQLLQGSLVVELANMLCLHQSLLLLQLQILLEALYALDLVLDQVDCEPFPLDLFPLLGLDELLADFYLGFNIFSDLDGLLEAFDLVETHARFFPLPFERIDLAVSCLLRLQLDADVFQNFFFLFYIVDFQLLRNA